MDVRAAMLDEILPLRQAVIIQGTDRESPYFALDFDQSTRHFGVFQNGRCLGCATFVRSEYNDGPAWQLRGMATVPELQHRGIGRMLLKFAEDHLAQQSTIKTLWCNARLPAVPFYRKMGWKTVSDPFTLEGVGPHRKMVKTLGP
jgi:predicted GNAT family N-acyltransferase